MIHMNSVLCILLCTVKVVFQRALILFFFYQLIGGFLSMHLFKMAIYFRLSISLLRKRVLF